MKNEIVIIGGSGGIGVQLVQIMNRNAVALSSRDMDITNFEQVKKKFDNAKWDVVINAAGYNYDGQIINQPQEEIDRQIDVNYKGFINILRACIPHMRNQKYGRIITFSSILGKKPIRGTSIYSSTKAAMDSLVKSAALENAKYNITVNSLSLGYFEAGMTHKVPENILNRVKENIPMQRFGKVEEIYNTIEWLISNSYVTGTNIEIGGGLHI